MQIDIQEIRRLQHQRSRRCCRRVTECASWISVMHCASADRCALDSKLGVSDGAVDASLCVQFRLVY